MLWDCLVEGTYIVGNKGKGEEEANYQVIGGLLSISATLLFPSELQK